MQTINNRDNAYLYITLSIFTTHFIIVGMINDNFSIDRVLITTLLSLTFLYYVIFKFWVMTKINLLANPLAWLFIYSFLQAALSPNINGDFETSQQQFISITYLGAIAYFLILREIGFSVNQYLKMVFILSAITVLFIISYMILNQESIYNAVIHFFKNIRILNQVQTILIPSLSLLLLLNNSRLIKKMVSVLLIFNFIILLETGARGTSISLVIAYCFLLISSYSNRRIRKNLTNVAFLFFVSCALYTLGLLLFDNSGLAEHLIGGTTQGRAIIYEVILTEMYNSLHLFDAIGFSSVDIAANGYLHPHNAILYVYLGAGFFGVFVFLMMVFYYLKKLFTYHSGSSKPIRKYLIAILAAAMAHSMVSGLYLFPLSNILLIGLFALISNTHAKHRDTEERNTLIKSYINIIVIVAVSIYSLVLLGENIKLLSKYEYSLEYRMDENKSRSYHPGIMLYSDLIYTKEEM